LDFFGVFNPFTGENTARTIPVRTSKEEDWLVASEAVDSDKIRWVISGFGSFKSAGVDGIFQALLKHGIVLVLYRRRGKG
jgi:hypothetical protein